jgi:hypothetical protein
LVLVGFPGWARVPSAWNVPSATEVPPFESKVAVKVGATGSIELDALLATEFPTAFEAVAVKV